MNCCKKKNGSGGGGGGDVDQPPLIMVCEVGKSAQLMWYICV